MAGWLDPESSICLSVFIVINRPVYGTFLYATSYQPALLSLALNVHSSKEH